jgi:hypothetical protein
MDKLVYGALTEVLSDPSRSLSLRTMAFDQLLLHEDAGTVSHLLGVHQNETLQTLKQYMTTRMAHLMETNRHDQRRFGLTFTLAKKSVVLSTYKN